jgi:phosphomannomutase
MTGKDALIVSVSGIRGVVGSGLTPEVTASFAAAHGTYLGGGSVVLSRDGRPSGDMLRHAALAGLVSVGCDVHDLGVAPTPTVGLAVRRLQAAGGIQITASHNPAEWNGLKLFGPKGCVLTAAEGKPVLQILETNAQSRAPWNKLGTVRECCQADDWHCERIMELVDVVRIRAAGLKVFLDANGGAGGPLARKLLDALQCHAICHGCHANGVFAHEPEPTAANLQTIGPMVVKSGAAVGFVLDPDADRLALFDETGHYIGEELTLALAVLFRLQRERGPVVVNMSTSRLVEDIAKRFDCPLYRAPVGEANVVEKVNAVGAVIGGEGNGGVIDPRVGGVRDPFIGMGMILNMLADAGKPLSALVADLPTYHIVKDKYTMSPDQLPTLFKELTRRWPDARVNHDDGLRLDWADRWIHVRPSNTEPIVRVIAEAPEEPAAQRLSADVKRALIAKD